MGSPYRVRLFDTDATLPTTGGAGATAWTRAFEDLHRISTLRAAGPDDVPESLPQELPR